MLHGAADRGADDIRGVVKAATELVNGDPRGNCLSRHGNRKIDTGTTISVNTRNTDRFTRRKGKEKKSEKT